MIFAGRRRRYDPATLQVVERLLQEFAVALSAAVVLRAVEVARSASPSASPAIIETLARADLEHRAARHPHR